MDPDRPRSVDAAARAASTPRLLGLDWGSSTLRAWLLGDAGRILERRESATGALGLDGSGFRAALRALCADWLDAWPRLPVLACGMIGSHEGWREAPRVPAPAGFEQLAAALLAFDEALGRPFRIVPGVMARGQIDSPDLMRGGETQVFGALRERDGLFVLPGTHSRWVEVRGRRIVALRTYMTGELYALLRRHSTLARLCADPDDSPAQQADALRAYDEALDHAAARPASLTHLLFTARAESLLDGLAAHQVPAYVSGLLIGAELADAVAWAPHDLAPTLVARSELSSRYARALHRSRVHARVADADSAAAGLYAIAQHAGLLA